jgi:hypothetical protein
MKGHDVAYDIEVPAKAHGTLLLNPAYENAVIDGTPLPSAQGNEKARGLLAPGTHHITFHISR